MILDLTSKKPLYNQIYQQIRQDILTGVMKQGSRLKSSRALSSELGISRNTVDLAYDHLFAEGFITSVPRKGYYVEIPDMLPVPDKGTFKETCCCSNKESHHDDKILYDFQSDKLLITEFPCHQWKKLLLRCIHEHSEESEEASVFGSLGLQTEIRRFLHLYSNVECSTEQILITTGRQHCLELACRLIKTVDSRPYIALEDPGFDQSRITLQNNGCQIFPMKLDSLGPLIPSIEKTDIGAAYVTPSHEFPTGIGMSLSRRKEFARWADTAGTYLIEDESNCFFHHNLKPLPPLHHLNPERTFYLGGFSDLLYPCVDVSFLVVPASLVAAMHRLIDQHTQFVPYLSQKPLELFLKEGHWDAHIRRVRKMKKEKCRLLIHALKHRFGHQIHISDFQSGMHLLIQAKWHITEEELVTQAYEAGILVCPVSKYWYEPEPCQSPSLLLHYSHISFEDIAPSVDRLYEAWSAGLEP